MTETIGGFFSGGAKGVTWPDMPPASVTGIIDVVHPPEAVLDPKDGKDTGKKQIRIVLKTDLRDPTIEEDDGRRTLYVKSYMRGAVGDALRKAGVKEPEIGGRLTVSFVRTEPPERPGLSASKHFEAQYVPAAQASAGQHLSNGGQTASPGTVPGSPQYQAAPLGPNRPSTISEAAWAQMDASTRQAVAASMGSDGPPF